ncbi:MAG: hypothetical protein E7103_08890 [Prevotella sp.]|nr:hypothetical protein [Prevotella sp.]
MKKQFFVLAAAVLMMAACGNKTGANNASAESTVTDSIATVAEEDIQKDIEAQLNTVYAKLREMDASGEGINTRELDNLFCSREFLELEDDVYEKARNATSPEETFSDEGWRWFPGISVAETVDSVTVELIMKGRVEVKFRLTDKRGVKARQHLVMLQEGGQWKIHNWIDEEAFPEGNYLDWMKSYLGAQTGEVLVAPDEDWTEEAVARQIKKYIQAFNETFAEGSGLSPFDLDKKYYTQYWNEVYNKVNEKDGKQPSVETCFFIDDNHWTGGLETPLMVQNIKVELTTGTTAEAVVTLKETEGGFSSKEILLLEYEKSEWRIHDWLEKSHDATGSILSNMEKYIEK